ncbi:MAG: hypothetical protein U5N85_22265 [Arcicella sp.]|nr:hypothetical protein [Arcicella sp.]
MKKLEITQMEIVNGGGSCGDTLSFLRGFAAVAAGSLTPIGIGVGVAVGLLAYGASCP